MKVVIKNGQIINDQNISSKSILLENGNGNNKKVSK